MSDNQFYSEIQHRFAQIIEKDKRRKRRSQYILLGIHAGIFIVTAIITAQFSSYINYQGMPTASLGWFGLVLAGILTLIAHIYAVFAANNTTVQDTVFESLMLLTAQHHLSEPESGKAKRRNRDESFELSDDGELVSSTIAKTRNGSS